MNVKVANPGKKATIPRKDKKIGSRTMGVPSLARKQGQISTLGCRNEETMRGAES